MSDRNKDWEVLLQVKLEHEDPKDVARDIEIRINAGECITEDICHVFSCRPISHELPNQNGDVLTEHVLEYPVGKLRNYYGPGSDDLEILRQAFRNYVEDDAAEHSRNVTQEEVDLVIDHEVQKVLESRPSLAHVHKLPEKSFEVGGAKRVSVELKDAHELGKQVVQYVPLRRAIELVKEAPLATTLLRGGNRGEAEKLLRKLGAMWMKELIRHVEAQEENNIRIATDTIAEDIRRGLKHTIGTKPEKDQT